MFLRFWLEALKTPQKFKKYPKYSKINQDSIEKPNMLEKSIKIFNSFWSYLCVVAGGFPLQVGGGLNPSSKPGWEYELNGCWDEDFTNVLDHLSPEAAGICADFI